MTAEWDDLRVFRAAVLAGDYTRAAKRLGMDRTTIGRRVARLENAMGIALWAQDEAGFRPSPAGDAVLRAAAGMEGAMDSLADDLGMLAGGRDGYVRLTGTAGLAPLLLGHLRPYLDPRPDLRIELVSGRDAIAMIMQRKADVGIALARVLPNGIVGRRVSDFSQRRYVASDGDASRAVAWGHDLLLANPQPWARINAPRRDAPSMEVDDLRAMIDAVRVGLGAAWLWDTLGDREPGLVALPDRAPAAAIAGLWVIHAADPPPGLAVDRLARAAAALIGDFVAGGGPTA